MAQPDAGWVEIATAVEVPASYAVIATTSLALSPLSYSTSIFGIRVNNLASLTTLGFRVQGSMDATLDTPEWFDLLASFPDSTNRVLNVAAYELNATPLIADATNFRIRVDEPWRWLRLLAEGAGGTGSDIDVLFRRF